MTCEPLVSDTAADAVARGELGDGEEPGEVGFDESHPFVHRTGLLPWHNTPSLSRGTVLPMFPVCFVTYVPGLYLCRSRRAAVRWPGGRAALHSASSQPQSARHTKAARGSAKG